MLAKILRNLQRIQYLNATMKKILFTQLILIISNNLNAQNNHWKNIVKEQKTIKNITYTFPAEISTKTRESYIQLREKSITEISKFLRKQSL